MSISATIMVKLVMQQLEKIYIMYSPGWFRSAAALQQGRKH